MKRFYACTLLVALAIAMVGCSTTGPLEEEELYAGALLENGKVEVDPLAMEDAVLELENGYRTSKGLAPLEEFPAVHKYAEAHTIYMISKAELSHDNFEARAESVAQESNAVRVSENVARYYSTAERVLESWIESSTHREALEGDFTHTSVSIQLDKAGRPYYTQLFFKVE